MKELLIYIKTGVNRAPEKTVCVAAYNTKIALLIDDIFNSQ